MNTKEALSRYKRKLRNLPRRLYLAATQPVRDRHLRALIESKRVLILGGGPSARDLECIPEDMLVFACNISPGILIEKGLSSDIDLYLASKNAIKDYRGRVESILKDIAIHTFVSRDLGYLHSRPNLTHYQYLLLDRFAGDKTNYGVKRLFGSNAMRIAVGKSRRKSPSSGIGLLLYALVYNAREVYVIGIDVDAKSSAYSGRANDAEGKLFSHKDTDFYVMELISKKFSHVYSASLQSPISKLFPFKSLV